jgi:hypothetical protein
VLQGLKPTCSPALYPPKLRAARLDRLQGIITNSKMSTNSPNYISLILSNLKIDPFRPTVQRGVRLPLHSVLEK